MAVVHVQVVDRAALEDAEQDQALSETAGYGALQVLAQWPAHSTDGLQQVHSACCMCRVVKMHLPGHHR